MDFLRTGHLWNAAILLAAIVVALAADRLSRVSVTGASQDPASFGDIAAFTAAPGGDSAINAYVSTISADPLEPRATQVAAPVAASGERPAARTARLTAILIADDRRVAVVDERAVSVGDVLTDGSRVAAIQANKVFLSKRNGQMLVLTLVTGLAR